MRYLTLLLLLAGCGTSTSMPVDAPRRTARVLNNTPDSVVAIWAPFDFSIPASIAVIAPRDSACVVAPGPAILSTYFAFQGHGQLSSSYPIQQSDSNLRIGWFGFSAFTQPAQFVVTYGTRCN